MAIKVHHDIMVSSYDDVDPRDGWSVFAGDMRKAACGDTMTRRKRHDYPIKQKISKLTEEAATSANVTATSVSGRFEFESVLIVRNIGRFYARSPANNLLADSEFVYDSARGRQSGHEELCTGYLSYLPRIGRLIA
jgi:hypothetical protein